MKFNSAERIKLVCLVMFGVFAAAGLLISDDLTTRAGAFSNGPPLGHTGAPSEQTCTNCHSPVTQTGQFLIEGPANYTPGQTYELVVRHVTTDATRLRWGFQMTSLTGGAMPAFTGVFTNQNSNTQVETGGQEGREYIQHTNAGTFAGTSGGVLWRVNWTAPATDVGPVTFYAAGNQADNNNNTSGDQIYTATKTMTPAPAINESPVFDFDGDGKTDVGIFRENMSQWWISRSSDGVVAATGFGTGASQSVVPGDFTGDGKTDIALWRQTDGYWYVLRSEDFSYFTFPFGTAGDIPSPADFDGDGKADATVFRPASATWFISLSGGGGTTIAQFGAAGDLPVPADYDGDGKADIAMFRPSDGSWWVNRSSTGVTFSTSFGLGSDSTVQGDYTGDGKADIAVWRPSTGFWYVLRSEDLTFFAFPFGAEGDIAAPGDFDGDGKFDATVFRPSNATWYSSRSTAGLMIVQFGAAGDVPLSSVYTR